MTPEEKKLIERQADNIRLFVGSEHQDKMISTVLETAYFQGKIAGLEDMAQRMER